LLILDEVTDKTKLAPLFMAHGVHPFNGLFRRTTWVSRHQKSKPFWILLEQRWLCGGSSISWTV